MKKHFLTIVLVALVGIFAYAGNDNDKKEAASDNAPAQTISVTGSVSDFVSGENLTGVEIKLEGTNLKTYSDFDGNFTFKNLKPGTYNIIASYISYDKSLVENFKAAKDNNELSIKLQASK